MMLGAVGVPYRDLLAMPLTSILLALWGYRQRQRHAELCANVVRTAWAEPYDFEPSAGDGFGSHPGDAEALAGMKASFSGIVWQTPDGLPPTA